MNAMHFDAFAFVDISDVRFFFNIGINTIVAIAKILNLLFLFYFGIVRYMGMDVVTLRNFYLEDFYSWLVVMTWHQLMIQTQKITWCCRLLCPDQNFQNLTLQHV